MSADFDVQSTQCGLIQFTKVVFVTTGPCSCGSTIDPSAWMSVGENGYVAHVKCPMCGARASLDLNALNVTLVHGKIEGDVLVEAGG